MGTKQTSDEIKALRRRIAEKRVELKSAEAESKEKADRVRDITTSLAELARSLQTLQEEIQDPVVTDHAVLRYLEREKGMDIDAIREEMLSERVVEMIRFTRTGKVSVGNGRRLVVKDMAVVSVL